VRGLRAFGAQIDFIVAQPLRIRGMADTEIVHLAAQSRPDILLTVDNGIASVDGVAEAIAWGCRCSSPTITCPVMSCRMRPASVNPNQPGCAFSSKHLAGVGVMFYVLLALRAELRTRGLMPDEVAKRIPELLDLVALGTVAERGEAGPEQSHPRARRACCGLRAGRACAGINALLGIAKKHPGKVTSLDLGFTVGPRLNAAGRLDDMSLGIACLLADDAATAQPDRD